MDALLYNDDAAILQRNEKDNMATNDAKTLTKEDQKLVVKALEGLKGSLMRSKTKEAADEQMVEIYEGRMRSVDALIGKITNKELF